LRGGAPFLDLAVAAVGDVDVARGVHRHAIGIAEPRGDQGDDGVRGSDPFLDRIVGGVGDVDIARSIDCHTKGRLE